MKTLLLLPFTTLLGLIAHQTIVDAATIELTPDNFDDMTAGKTVFIKFFAPWYVSYLFSSFSSSSSCFFSGEYYNILVKFFFSHLLSFL